jgi:hypothetical protein
MIKYTIEIDDNTDHFHLYRNGQHLETREWVGELLQVIAGIHHVDNFLSDCLTESQEKYKLELFSMGDYSIKVIE